MASYRNPKDYKKAYAKIREQIETDFDNVNDYWYIMGMAACAEEIGAITRAQFDELKDLAIDKKCDIEESERGKK